MTFNTTFETCFSCELKPTFVFSFFNDMLCNISLNTKILSIIYSPTDMFNDPHHTHQLAIKTDYFSYNLKYLQLFFDDPSSEFRLKNEIEIIPIPPIILNHPIIINNHLTIKSCTSDSKVFEKYTDCSGDEINRYLHANHVYEFKQRLLFDEVKPKFLDIEIHLLNNEELSQLILSLFFSQQERHCNFLQNVIRAQSNYLVIILDKWKYSMRNNFQMEHDTRFIYFF